MRARSRARIIVIYKLEVESAWPEASR